MSGAALLPIRTLFKLSNQPCNRKLNNARVNSQGTTPAFFKIEKNDLTQVMWTQP